MFIFVAGVAFMGFIIGALFNRIKVTKILPLMLLGMLAGPVLHIINTSTGSVVANLVPIISALAISFILFDVGLNINIFRLGKIFARASAFTFVLAAVSGIVISAVAYMMFGWSAFESLIFGFALSGPSSVIVPTLVKSLKMKNELGDTLVYEGVATDALQLVVPILLLQLMLTSQVTIAGAFGLFIASIFGAVILGAVLAMLWLYMLKSFKDYSKSYGWMLTITMVLATYGIAYQLNLSTPIAIFTFGIVFANLGMMTFKAERPSESTKTSPMRRTANLFIMQYLHLGNSIRYIKEYQTEIGFFTSTFFFVYIGLLFNVGSLTALMIAIAVVITILMVLLRYLFLPMIGAYMPPDPAGKKLTTKLLSFDVSRGLSPAIVATLPLAAGIIIPGFLNQIFLIILFSNIASTLGVFVFYKPAPEAPSVAKKSQAQAVA